MNQSPFPSFDTIVSPQEILSDSAQVLNQKWLNWLSKLKGTSCVGVTNSPKISVKEEGKPEVSESIDFIEESTEGLCYPLDLFFEASTLEAIFGGKVYEDFQADINPNILTSLFCNYWDIGQQFQELSLAVLRMMVAARIDGKLRLKDSKWIYV